MEEHSKGKRESEQRPSRFDIGFMAFSALAVGAYMFAATFEAFGY
jgi:hypothetical protein